MEALAEWLKSNNVLVKMLFAFAAPGGIWFWIDKYKTRIQIKIRSVRLSRDAHLPRALFVELENISPILTSLEPTFKLSGYLERRLKRLTFVIDGNDRQLPSHLIKTCTGWHNDAQNLILLRMWYMTLEFPLSRGRVQKIRVRNIQFERAFFASTGNV